MSRNQPKIGNEPRKYINASDTKPTRTKYVYEICDETGEKKELKSRK